MSHSPAGSLKYCPTRKMLPGKCAPHHAVRLRSLGLDAVPRNTGFQSSCHDFSSNSASRNACNQHTKHHRSATATSRSKMP